MYHGLHMETEQKTPSHDATKNMSAAMWAAGIMFAAILVLVVILFVIPGPARAPVQGELATTTEEVASEVKEEAATTKPAPSAPASSYPAAGSRFIQNGVYVTVIQFNGKSFNPASVTITHGEEVRFVNTSNLTMDIGSQNPNASSPAYSALNQPAAKGKGGTYQIGLTEVCVWSYANQTSNPTIKGVVNVK